MPNFAFKARAKDGRTASGVRAAPDAPTLARDLNLEGLFLLKATPVSQAKARMVRGPRMNRKELVAFLVHLGSYVEAGVPLLGALEDFRMPDKPAVDAAIRDMRRRLEGGSSLSETMEVYPSLFSHLHVSMIRAGEGSGNLDEAIREVVKLVEWDEDFSAQVKSASTYPMIVVGILGLIILVVSIFVLPKINKLLTELNVPLPLPTRIFMGIGDFMGTWGWMLGLLLLAGFIAFRLALRNPEVRLWWDTRVLRMPVLGSLVTKMGLSRFATFFSVQYRAGVPIIQVLRECQDVTGNARLAECVRRIREGIESGERLAVMAASVGFFPALVVRMLAIGEEAGNLEKTLEKVSLYFDAEVKAGIKRFFQLLEPALMVFMAGVIVFVAVSILLPIYTLIGNINAQAR